MDSTTDMNESQRDARWSYRKGQVFDYNFLMLGQFRCEGPQPLSAGKHTIVFDFTYDGPGPNGNPALTAGRARFLSQ